MPSPPSAATRGKDSYRAIRTDHECTTIAKTRWFRAGFRFRAGIEGRISVLGRRYGLDRCPEHGEEGMGRHVGWGIVTSNLVKIAETVA